MSQNPGGWGGQYPAQQPQQGWGQPPAQQAPQQGWGQPPAQPQQQNPWSGGQAAPQQQAPQGPAPIAAQAGDEFDDFFSGGVKGEPGFDWGATQNAGKARQGANIAGVIVEMVQMQQTDFATKQPKFYPDGQPMMQVAITLQTQLRGWEGIKPDQIPVDPNTGQPKHPSQDVGLRRIYVKNDMKRAVTEACNKVGQKPRKGGQLAVQLKGFEDRGKGNPLPLYDAVYQPAPDDGGTAGFFQASGPGQQMSAGQDAQQPPMTYAQGSSFGGGDRGLQAQPPMQAPPQAPPAGYGQPPAQPAYQPPQGQGYAPEQGGQPPAGQYPSQLGDGPAPTTPPDFAQQPQPTQPAPGNAPQYDQPPF